MYLQGPFPLGFIGTVRTTERGFLLAFVLDVLVQRLPVFVRPTARLAFESAYKNQPV